MRVERIWSSDGNHPITAPFPPDGKHFFFALTRGDVAHPYHGEWFKEPIFDRVIRFWSAIPLPFFSWRLFGQQGYAGFKVWGMDEENPASGIYDQFRRWLKPEDVYPGSRAMHLSIRNGLTVIVPWLLVAAYVALWAPTSWSVWRWLA